MGAKLVPACGALWGVTPPDASLATLSAVESAVGRRFDIVYRFHDINDAIPDAEDQKVLAGGAILHIALDPRDYASSDRAAVSWRNIAAGQYDANLRAQAAGIAAIGAPVFVTFGHEPDQPAKSALGTPDDFIAAWRHVHDIFAQQGAGNVVWVWVVTGWPPAFARALQMWPGNDYVDWISWEAYNFSGCQSGRIDPSQWQSFSQVALQFYEWLMSHGPGAGVDVGKPMMFSEAGTVVNPDDDQAAADWYASIPAFLEAHPQIKAVSLWDHTDAEPACDFRFSGSEQLMAAVAAAGRSDWVSHPR